MLVVPKKWQEFQHYKDRNPPWIRLHRGLLDNREFNALPPMACKVLVLLWLVASDAPDGIFDDNADDLAFRLRMPVKEISAALSAIKQKGFLVPANQPSSTEDGRPLSRQIAERNGFGSRHISDQVKREVWARDEGTCQLCQSKEAIEYDHKNPVSKGGNSEIENVWLLCRPCNRAKRTKTAEQAATHAQRKAASAYPETEAETEASTETEPEAETGFGQPPVGGKPAGKKSAGSVAWDGYAAAYVGRYGVPPVRNAQTNSQMAQVVGKLGADESSSVAAFYVAHQGRFYVQGGHSVGLLLRDAEKLRTEWATGRQVTATQAAQADRTQTNLNTFGVLIAEAKAKEANGKLEAA